jgi:hypothetical protein
MRCWLATAANWAPCSDSILEVGALAIEEVVLLEAADLQGNAKKLMNAFAGGDLRSQQAHLEQGKSRQADDQQRHCAVAEDDFLAQRSG